MRRCQRYVYKCEYIYLSMYRCLFVCSDISIVLYVRCTKNIYNIVEQPKWREFLITMLINNAIEIKYG